jgi:LmbE family N-acetylglucosaminyl deacetylase
LPPAGQKTDRWSCIVLSVKLDNLGRPPVVLCIGAHCDDIEIGCGATLASWSGRYPEARFQWAVFSGDQVRQHESTSAAHGLLAGTAELRFFGFRDGFFPSHGAQIKETFEQLKATVHPDVIFTHYLHDRHQDHALLANLTWNTFRSQLILEYEIPKYEGDLGQPNVFVPLEAQALDRKIRCLIDCFASQRSRAWFTEETFRALARLRGLECAAPSGYAEAFHARKLCLS